MNSYRADIFNDSKLVNRRYYQAADMTSGLNIAQAELRQPGRTHADVYEGDGLGGAYYVGTVTGGAR